MAKNTIGQFIAALRKANGMTQQDVADRLNVSNKAVSRWERDECAPDLSVIPALAEMFGVTCDELLKGERIMESAQVEKKEPRVEKQVKNLVNRTLSSFKTLIWISLAAAVVGLVCMFGISYGFYRPVIGFAVKLLFEACASVIAILAVSRTKDMKTDNELFEMADDSLVSRFNNTLGSLSFAAFFAIFAVVLASLPFILVTSDYVNSVVTPYSYITVFAGGIALVLALAWLKCRNPYMTWIASGELPQKQSEPIQKSRRRMTLVQVLLTVIAGVLFVIAPYFDNDPNETPFLYTATVLIGLACLLASIISFIVFLIKTREERKKLLIPGIRNTLLIPSALIVSEMHSMGWWHDPGSTVGQRYESWHTEYLWYALALAVIIFVVFSLIDVLIQKKSK